MIILGTKIRFRYRTPLLSNLRERCAEVFNPTKGQFKIYYIDGAEHPEYVPDFDAEIIDCVLKIETKSQAEMTDAIVQAKVDAASKWSQNASEYLLKNGRNAWKYLLIPRDEVKENFQLGDFVRKFIKNNA